MKCQNHDQENFMNSSLNIITLVHGLNDFFVAIFRGFSILSLLNYRSLLVEIGYLLYYIVPNFDGIFFGVGAKVQLVKSNYKKAT